MSEVNCAWLLTMKSIAFCISSLVICTLRRGPEYITSLVLGSRLLLRYSSERRQNDSIRHPNGVADDSGGKPPFLTALFLLEWCY
jgi:hypothetical protein